MKKNSRYSKLKRIGVVLLMQIVCFAGYVAIVTRNNHDMTGRQRILKAVYPAFMWITRVTGRNTDKLENKTIVPPVSFYSLRSTTIDGKSFPFESLKGKKVLLVNTASDCGYTNQYEELEKLYQQYKGSLVVVGFPANDFKEQEKGSNQEIAAFCKANYGVSFPMMEKTVVKKNTGQHEVFQWLTDTAKNGWNKQAPTWNFSKYLVDENGKLIHYFGPSVTPLSDTIINSISQHP